MKQPSVYSRSMIVDTAFELIREEGWDAVTTRAIAKKMGSSTMPIYSHVQSVEELEKELRMKARELQKSYQRHSYTEHVLLNLAYGYVVFARDEKNLFRFLYLETSSEIDLENGKGMSEVFFMEFGEESEETNALLELKKTGQENLIQHTWIFTHGLATLVNAGTFGSNSDKTIMQFLKNAGEAFYIWDMQKEEGKNNG